MPQERWVLVGLIDVSPGMEREFTDWFRREHIPAMKKVPGVLGVRLLINGQPRNKYVALYELTSPRVPGSAAWEATRYAGRTAEIRPHIRNSSYTLYWDATAVGS